MKSRLAILCAVLLSLTGCTGQAEPVAAASGAASSSAVAESSSEPAPSSTREPVGEPEVPSEPGSSDAAEFSSVEELSGEPESSSAAESSSTVELSSEPSISSAAEPSSAAETVSGPEPSSSDPDKIPGWEPEGPLEPPPPLTPEEIEERRRGDEKQAAYNRLARRLAALVDKAREVLPEDIFNDLTWRTVPSKEEGGYGSVDAIILYVTNEAVARELMEPYTDPEIPFLYREVKYTRAEIDAIFEDVQSQEIIQEYEKQGKIYHLWTRYNESDQVVEVCTNDPEPELERWLKTYKYADFILLSEAASHKRNPA